MQWPKPVVFRQYTGVKLKILHNSFSLKQEQNCLPRFLKCNKKKIYICIRGFVFFLFCFLELIPCNVLFQSFQYRLFHNQRLVDNFYTVIFLSFRSRKICFSQIACIFFRNTSYPPDIQLVKVLMFIASLKIVRVFILALFYFNFLFWSCIFTLHHTKTPNKHGSFIAFDLFRFRLAVSSYLSPCRSSPPVCNLSVFHRQGTSQGSQELV